MVGPDTESTNTNKQAIPNSDVNTDIYKLTLEFINGSKYLMDYNNMINVFNAIGEHGDQICTFKNILVHRN